MYISQVERLQKHLELKCRHAANALINQQKLSHNPKKPDYAAVLKNFCAFVDKLTNLNERSFNKLFSQKNIPTECKTLMALVFNISFEKFNAMAYPTKIIKFLPFEDEPQVAEANNVILQMMNSLNAILKKADKKIETENDLQNVLTDSLKQFSRLKFEGKALPARYNIVSNLVKKGQFESIAAFPELQKLAAEVLSDRTLNIK